MTGVSYPSADVAVAAANCGVSLPDSTTALEPPNDVTLISLSAFTPGPDPNFWQRFQYGGVNPVIVLDFSNGMYWNGSSTSTDPTAFVNNGTVTTGKTTGLGPLTGAVMTAKGALLTAFQNSAYALQCTTYNLPSSFTGAGAVIANQVPDYLILADNGGSVESLTGGGSHLTLGTADWPIGQVTTLSANSGLRRISAVCGGGTVGAAGSSAADVNPLTANTTVYLGSQNGSIPPGGGYIQQLALYNQILPAQVIPWPAFTGTNGIWWGGSLAAAVTYGNVLQYEYTQPFTMIAAILIPFNVGAGVDNITGFIAANVMSGSPFTGYEFWINGSGFLDVRLQHAEGASAVGVYGGTNICDGLWHVVACTYDGSGLAAGVHIYVDGVAESLTVEFDNLGGQSIKNAANSYMLLNASGAGAATIGAIGFFEQSNIVRPLSYIQQFKLDQKIPPVDSSVVLRPKLNEGGSNTTTGDLSQSGLTGTLSSSSLWLRG